MDAGMRDGAGAIIRAAGGVVWRRTPGGALVEVAVIHRPRYDDWSLPKGKLAPGEAEVEGAVREVLEETGFHVRVGRPLGETRYEKVVADVSRPKVVRWWAMEAAAGTFSPTLEVDRLRWVGLDEADRILTRETDRDVLHRFAQGPAPTRTLLVVRHARAGSAASWAGDDRERPLDPCGQAQADELVRLLARFDVETIWAPSLKRCIDSMAPFAAAFGLAIGAADVLSEAGYPGREDEAVDLVRSAAGTRDVAVCSQGDVIPDLVARLAAADQVDLPRPVAAAKGSTWALTVSDGRILDAEYFAPPRPAECNEDRA
jgi:8-oxo-dGTP diphosphatase